MIDSSGTVTQDNADWDILKQFLTQLVDRLDIGADRVRLGIVNYAGQAKVEFFLEDNTNRDELKRAINAIDPLRTSTNTGGALRTLRETFFEVLR